MSRQYRFSEIVKRMESLHPRVEVLLEDSGDSPPVSHPNIHRPGMGLMGYVSGFHRERVQVFGTSELGYLDTLEPEQKRAALRRILELDVPGIFLAKWSHVPPYLLEEARAANVPVAQVLTGTEDLTHLLRDVLLEMFAPHTTRHGTLVDVYGVGLLITGRSGIGKSEIALDLVERGHRLVADDLVHIVRKSRDVVMGMGRENTQHLMEIRGLGIIDVLPTFGVRAIRMQKRIELEVQLEEWDDDADYDRHGLDRDTVEILGVDVAKVVVPIFPGKNITVIAETIALDFMLKVYGIDSAHDFNRKLIETMSADGQTTRYLKHDLE